MALTAAFTRQATTGSTRHELDIQARTTGVLNDNYDTGEVDYNVDVDLSVDEREYSNTTEHEQFDIELDFGGIFAEDGCDERRKGTVESVKVSAEADTVTDPSFDNGGDPDYNDHDNNIVDNDDDELGLKDDLLDQANLHVKAQPDSEVHLQMFSENLENDSNLLVPAAVDNVTRKNVSATIARTCPVSSSDAPTEELDESSIHGFFGVVQDEESNFQADDEVKIKDESWVDKDSEETGNPTTDYCRLNLDEEIYLDTNELRTEDEARETGYASDDEPVKESGEVDLEEIEVIGGEPDSTSENDRIISGTWNVESYQVDITKEVNDKEEWRESEKWNEEGDTSIEEPIVTANSLSSEDAELEMSKGLLGDEECVTREPIVRFNEVDEPNGEQDAGDVDEERDSTSVSGDFGDEGVYDQVVTLDKGELEVEVDTLQTINGAETEEQYDWGIDDCYGIMVIYEGQEMSLFPPTREKDTLTFLLQDSRLIESSIWDILQNCRTVLAECISEAEELVMRIPGLELVFSEDSMCATRVSLVEVLDVFNEVEKTGQGRIKEINGVKVKEERMYILIERRMKMSARMEMLRAGISKRKTNRSEVEEEDEVSEEEDSCNKRRYDEMDDVLKDSSKRLRS